MRYLVKKRKRKKQGKRATTQKYKATKGNNMSGPLSPSSILREFQSHSRQHGRQQQQQHHQFMPTINETASQVRVMQRSNNSANAGNIGGGGSGGSGGVPMLAASTSAVHNQAPAFGLSGSTWTPLVIGVCVLAVIAIVGGTGYYLWHWFTESKKAAAKAEQVREAIRLAKEKENEDEQQQQKTTTEPQQLEANQLKSQLDQIKAQYLAQVQNAQQQTLASQQEIQMLRQQLQHSMQQLQYQQQHTHQQQQQHMTKAASAPTQAPIHAQRPMRVQAPTQVQNQPTHNIMQGHTQEMMGAAEDQDMSMDDDAPLPLSEDAAEPEQPEQQEQQEVEQAEPRHSEENNDFMVI